MNSLRLTAFELQNMLSPVADIIIKKTMPCKDELTMHQAQRKYTRRWVDHHVKEGNIVPVRRGNRMVVSNADLSCLWAAEHQLPGILTD
jgi:hypothetical protein